jgi:hypothetical protein
MHKASFTPSKMAAKPKHQERIQKKAIYSAGNAKKTKQGQDRIE